MTCPKIPVTFERWTEILYGGVVTFLLVMMVRCVSSDYCHLGESVNMNVDLGYSGCLICLMMGLASCLLLTDGLLEGKKIMKHC